MRIVLMRGHLRRTVTIALVVGTIIAVINHTDVILRGDATGGTWAKIGLTYLVAFVVSNLGLLPESGSRPSARSSPRGSGRGGSVPHA